MYFKDIEQFDIHVAEEEHKVVSLEKSWGLRVFCFN